jgi:8-oxo-dGTP pyrophosphatase MutT (NUDIX family)
VRAIILRNGRLLLVNAWPGGQSDLLCAPGGGVEPHQSLPDNLKREVHEETGLDVAVEDVVLVNEFHDPERAFHQVDIYFRCKLLSDDSPAVWEDPEGIVTERRWVTRDELASCRVKPDSLADVAWSNDAACYYDALEPLVR